MSSQKVDYSELVSALQGEDRGDANRLLKKLGPRLCQYLEVVMDAEPEDARDAVQQTLMKTYEKIMNGEITDKQYVYKYMITVSRNFYLRLMRYDDRYEGQPEDYAEHMVVMDQQIANLHDKDRQRALEACLKKLSEDSRKYISYIIRHPDASTGALSKRFDISEANVRVKKSRIISDLSHCVKKKLGE